MALAASRGGIAWRSADITATFARHLARVRDPLPRRLRTAFTELGPTFVKVGQVIASSPGLFPPDWREEFGSLRDRVPPFPTAVARRIVEEDLGRPVGSVFSAFDDVPLAAASIAQVHGARLLDGRQVVVKVQRPRLDEQVRDELRALLIVCELLERIPQASVGSPRALAEDFARTLHEEMDFRLEAENMDRMRRILVESQIDDCRVPEVHHDLVGRRVLTMERIDGLQFGDVEAMHLAGIDTERLLRLGVQTVVEGVLVHGFFHGDLHAGNMTVLPDGTFVLFDFGIVGRLTESTRTRLATYLMAVTTNDYPAMVRALRSFGSVPPDVDVDDMARTIQELYEPFVQEGVVTAQLGQLMDTMIRSMVRYRVRIPRELVLLTKQMLYLEGAAATLAPDADLLEEQTLIYATLMTKYPDLATEIGLALQRGREMDEAIAAGHAVPEPGGGRPSRVGSHCARRSRRVAGVTATTDPGAPARPEPAWVVPEHGPTALDRLRAWKPWAPPALVGGLVGLATAYTAWNDPTTGGGVFPGCPLKELTGLDCPGCGGTRAVHSLTNGDIGTAFDHNALLTIVLPLLALAWAVWMVHAVRTTLARRRDTAGPGWPAYLRVPRFSQRGWLSVIAVIVAFAVIRNIDAVPVLDYLSSEA